MTLLDSYIDQLARIEPKEIRGQVESVRGLTVRVADFPAPMDSAVEIAGSSGAVPGQVVGFDGAAGSRSAVVMSLGRLEGIGPGDRVRMTRSAQRLLCSPMMAGRVVDALGRPMDGKGPIRLAGSAARREVNVRAVNCMRRVPICKPIGTGIRAVDALLTCGMGQRLGIFAGPGVGKSTLMSMIAKNTSADVAVIALIGERGREVQDFLQHSLGEEGLRRTVMVVSTADDPPILRVRAARAASTVAEYFRDEGLNVLLLVDSLTRMAHAQRQIGLSVGEPPATKGYTPSVFALLPEILERAGQTDKGSITGFYTVLVEGDDFNEPIADAVKGITDGHLWLDRKLANRGHFPAIDVLQSISRVRPEVTDGEHQRMANRVSQLLATYADLEDLVNIGAYTHGASPLNDLAVRMNAKVMDFLKQPTKAPVSLEQAKVQLTELSVAIDRESKLIEQQQRQGAAQAVAKKK
jgi:flagellum-specific ATP synthase